MLYLMAATALAFALNAEPTPKPYGPAIETQASVRIAPAEQTVAEAAPQSETSPRDDDRNRAYVCVDDDCKTTSPVYNTRTPMEADTRSFRSSW